jgi:hypothetical protein
VANNAKQSFLRKLLHLEHVWPALPARNFHLYSPYN